MPLLLHAFPACWEFQNLRKPHGFGHLTLDCAAACGGFGWKRRERNPCLLAVSQFATYLAMDEESLRANGTADPPARELSRPRRTSWPTGCEVLRAMAPINIVLKPWSERCPGLAARQQLLSKPAFTAAEDPDFWASKSIKSLHVMTCREDRAILR